MSGSSVSVIGACSERLRIEPSSTNLEPAPHTARTCVARADRPHERQRRKDERDHAQGEHGRVLLVVIATPPKGGECDDRNGKAEHEESQCFSERAMVTDDLIGETELVAQCLATRGSEKGCDRGDHAEKRYSNSVALSEGWTDRHDECYERQCRNSDNRKVHEQWVGRKAKQTQHDRTVSSHLIATIGGM